jgi:hypothetical protein
MITSRVQFLRASALYIPTFSTILSNHSVKIIENSPMKISWRSMNTYICNHCSLLSLGFLFYSLEKYLYFMSIHSLISSLFDLQNIPLNYNYRSSKWNHLLACGWEDPGLIICIPKKQLYTNIFGITCRASEVSLEASRGVAGTKVLQ